MMIIGDGLDSMDMKSSSMACVRKPQITKNKKSEKSFDKSKKIIYISCIREKKNSTRLKCK